MAEKFGLLFSVVIFSIFMMPTVLDIFTFNVTTSQFLTASTEMNQLVKEEGGVTDRVQDMVNSSAISYSFKNENGETVDGIANVGDVIHISYEYNWKGIFAKETLQDHNTVRVARR